LARKLRRDEKRAGLPVAWARSREEAVEWGYDFWPGHPGRVDGVCVGDSYGDEDIQVIWYQRPTESRDVFAIASHDLDVISEDEFATRTARIDRGEPPT
jgi:hypothetical protein